MSNKTFLINQFIKSQNLMSRLQSRYDYLFDRFMRDLIESDEEFHEVLVDLPADIKDLAEAMAKISENFELLQSTGSTIKGSYHYGYTIGSDEKESPDKVMLLYRRFINSADFKNSITSEWYFEKGKEGFIHLHGIASFAHRQKRSVNDLSTRYGKLKGKQYNFFNKRLKYQIDVIKWNKYIKKDELEDTHVTHKHLLIQN